MSISLTCDCGQRLRVKETQAGRKVRCPTCRTVMTVPAPVEEQTTEDEVLNVLLSDSPGEEETRPPARRVEQITAEPDSSAPPPTAPAPPRKRLPRSVARDEKPRRGPRVAFEQGWFGSVNSGVAGGILMMLIAAVWFIVGIAGGRIFFYPPILFVIGLVSMFKGLFGGE